MSGGKATVAVNGVEWSVNTKRKEEPCTKCETPTKGRIGQKPWCTDCGMEELMMPVRNFRDKLLELLAPSLDGPTAQAMRAATRRGK